VSTRQVPRGSRREMSGATGRRSRGGVCRGQPHASPSASSARLAPCDGDARFVVEQSGGSGEMTIWASTQVPHELGCSAPVSSVCPSSASGSSCANTGGGFGQKRSCSRRDVPHAGGADVPAPIKWIEDRRENLMSAGQSRHDTRPRASHSTGRIPPCPGGRPRAGRGGSHSVAVGTGGCRRVRVEVGGALIAVIALVGASASRAAGAQQNPPVSQPVSRL